MKNIFVYNMYIEEKELTHLLQNCRNFGFAIFKRAM